MAKFNILTSMLLDTGGYTKGINKAKQDTASLGNSFKNVGRGITDELTKIATGFLAAFAAQRIVSGIKNTINNLQQMSDRLLDLNQITGANTDTLQEWQYVAKVSGVNTEAFSNAVEGFTQRMARGTGGGKDFNDAIKQLNISIKDAEGNLRNGADVTEEAIEKLAAMDNVTQRNIIGAKLFTGAWKDLAPIMGNGVEGIKNIRQEAHNLGLVFENEALVKANDFRIELQDLNLRVTQIKNNIGMSLIPMLSNLANGFRSTIDVIREAFNEGVKSSMESDLEEINDLAKRYLNKGLVSTLEEGKEKAARDLLKSLEKQKEYYKGYYGDISQLADREERIFARNRMKDLTMRINTLKSFVISSNNINGGLITSSKEEVDITQELKKETEKYNQALIDGDKEAAIASFRRIDALNIEIERINAQKEALEQLIKEEMYLELLQEKNKTPQEKLTRATSLPGNIKTPPPTTGSTSFEEVDYSAWSKLNEVMGETLSTMDLVNLATDGLNAAFNSLFSESSSSMKDFIGGLIKMVQGLFASTLAAQFMAYASSPQNVATGGLWLLGGVTAGLAAVSAMWENLIPEFATGGIITGPTLGIMGEYPGVKNNPEVIAPLSKLTELLGGTDGNVRFRIERDALIGIENSHKKELIYF